MLFHRSATPPPPHRTLPLTLAAALASAIVLLPGAASAGSDDPSIVAGLAEQAVELVTSELGLVQQADDESGPSETVEIARLHLRQVDQAGVRVLMQLDQLEVRLTPAIRAALDPLPIPDPDNDAFRRPPSAIVYEAAVADLMRIGATPAAVLPDVQRSGSHSLSLLLVAAGALLLLATAALASAVRNEGAEDLEAMAWSDGLTGVANRRRLDRDLDEHGQTSFGPTSVIMIDLDHFKLVNDKHGHAMGDDVLRRVASLLTRLVRRGDVVYRYGGEEFCVLLPNATNDEARRVAERIVTAIRTVTLPDGTRVTASVGIADGEPAQVSDTLRFADQAMITAKAGGRNRVECVGDVVSV